MVNKLKMFLLSTKGKVMVALGTASALLGLSTSSASAAADPVVVSTTETMVTAVSENVFAVISENIVAITAIGVLILMIFFVWRFVKRFLG